jgi:mono/diheme cytochrome c family protein
MLFDPRKILHVFVAVALLTSSMISAAHADDDDDDDDKHMPAAYNALWQTECGSCHVAFPPRLLPAESWQAVMTGLDKHFGSDASLDAPSAREIGAFLDKNAGRNRHAKSGKSTMRITETRWFVREHDEVSNRVWKNPKVKSAANCAACHTKAESGSYRERDIMIPK